MKRATLIMTSLLMVFAVACVSDAIEPSEPNAFDTDAKHELDAFLQSAIERYQVPGVAVAVIERGRVVYEATAGVRDMDSGAPVTPRTSFLLASAVKPITSLMMATLADDGILDWDTPARDIVPGFALANPDSTRLATLRHLSGMSSGLPEYFTSLFMSEATPLELLDRLKELPLVGAPGEVYAYSNQAFTTGAYAAALLAGASFDDVSLPATYERLMRERIFAPLGMSSATLDFEAASIQPDHAVPHRFMGTTGENVVLPVERERFVVQVAPGGGLWSDVGDMANSR